MSSSSLLGVYIEHYGTIKRQYLELNSGLNVLYGLNGAGKSQILDCISKTISNDDVFSKLGGPFPFGQNPTLASLVFEPSRNGAYFHENTRHWHAEGVPSFSHLPSSDDVLEAILGYYASEQIARRTESTQIGMHFELFDLKKESERIVRETTSDGLLVLVPVPFSNTFQVIYCIKKNAESTIFQNAWRKLREAMTRAHLKYQETWEDDGEQHEIWPEALKGLEDSPFYNIFTLQGSLIDKTLYDWGTGWSSSLDHEGLLTWPMPFVPIASLGFVRRPPIRFIDESKDESLDILSRNETGRMLGAAYQEYRKELYGEINKGNQGPPASYTSYKLSKEVQDKFSADVSNSVNQILQSFMFGLPKPNFDVGAPDRWMSSLPPVWKFSINDHEVGFESLSNVQKRFCKLAIQIDQHLAYTSFESEEDEDDQTEELPTLLIVDEPERGLNRTSEDYMAKGFANLEEKKIHSLVASHSPSFLNNGNARVNLVEISNSGTTIKPLKMMDTSNMSALGLRPGDLLQMYKVFWLVEGEHELRVFEELFRDELENYKIKIIPLRGVKSLASVADSSMLFKYTNAKILVTVDNMQNAKLISAWTSAKEMIKNKQPVNKVVGDLRRNLDEKTGEVRNLLELMSSSIYSGNWDRLEFSSLTKKDLIEYFAPEAFKLKSDWPTLRSQHDSQKNRFPDFKEFLRVNNGAHISTNALVEACKTLDAIDPDWTECLRTAIKLSEEQL
jgi:energy-coupling factor transporter ATP-binding protein EcfA2